MVRRLSQRLDDPLARLDRAQLHQRTCQPAPQHATPHRARRPIDRPQETALVGALATGLRQLQVPPGGGIQPQRRTPGDAGRVQSFSDRRGLPFEGAQIPEHHAGGVLRHRQIVQGRGGRIRVGQRLARRGGVGQTPGGGRLGILRQNAPHRLRGRRNTRQLPRRRIRIVLSGVKLPGAHIGPGQSNGVSCACHAAQVVRPVLGQQVRIGDGSRRERACHRTLAHPWALRDLCFFHHRDAVAPLEEASQIAVQGMVRETGLGHGRSRAARGTA